MNTSSSHRDDDINEAPDDVESSQASDQEDQDTSTPDESSSPSHTPRDDFNKRALLSDLHKVRSERKSLRSQVEELQAQVSDKEQITEMRDTLQARYDRLESFLLAFGGDISAALDSRSFTKDLFESDKDVAELVDQWHKAHPSHTSSALGANSSGGNDLPSLNDLLRAAQNA